MPSSPKKITALIQHEVLNILTSLRFLVEAAEPLDEPTRKTILDSMAWGAILVGQPELFHGKQSRLFLTQTSLNELLELAIILQEKKDGLRIKDKLDSPLVDVMTDKNRTKDILAGLLRFVLQYASQIEVKLSGNKLSIHHHQATLLLPTYSLLDCLTASKMTYFERIFCTLLHQASEAHLKIISKKGVVEIYFELVGN